ncbi:MAG: hypothetical protein AAFR52_00355 [Pseudomonadota bacterium]
MRLASAIALVALVAGCAAEPGAPAVEPDGPTASETALRDGRDALSETMEEAVALGAIGGAAVGGGFRTGFTGGGRVGTGQRQRESRGVRVGVPLGAAAGSYVAAVQRNYASREARLDKILEDLDRTNGEATETLAALRRVLEESRVRLAALRREIDTSQSARAALELELEDLEENVRIAEAAVEAAETREDDLGAARRLVDDADAEREIDPRLDQLARRIAEMRAVAEALADEA